jgi:excisionase family DNA binding protein
MTAPARDVLSPREVADRAGFSYHAILRAIRRGDLQAFEPVPGHYRIPVDEYQRWLHTPARPTQVSDPQTTENANRRSRSRSARAAASDPGSFARLTAIEGNG